MPFEAHFAYELPDFHVVNSMPGVDGFTLKVDALYKVSVGRTKTQSQGHKEGHKEGMTLRLFGSFITFLLTSH